MRYFYLSLLRKQLCDKRDEEIAYLISNLKSEEKKVEEFKGYEDIKTSADILSANSYLIKRGQDKAVIKDFNNNEVTIPLDASLTVSENINAYYQRYKRAERIYQNAINEVERLKNEIERRRLHYESLLAQNSKVLFEKELGKQSKGISNELKGPGLRVESHGFELIVGRNSKENDELLRHHMRGNDLWLHTRDFAGGYVFIKAKKDKSVPLEVLLDAGNLAVHYSKAKSNKKASLYYTHVKYLRRVKNGKQGLVIPTMEKNLDITLDEKRVKELLSEGGELL